MKIFVTGASGFLGTHIVNHFAKKNWHVCGLVRKLDGLLSAKNVTWQALELPSTRLTSLLDAEHPDVIVHTAASAYVNASLVNPYQDLLQSVVVWGSVLEAVRLSGLAPRIIYLSSAAVYGNPIQLPIHESAPIAPISPYGHHKRICEEIATYYAQLYAFDVTSLRIFSAYGIGLRRQILWDIVQKALINDQLALNGTGDESRDFIYASDVARAIDFIIHSSMTTNKATLPIYNVGSGISSTIRQVAQLTLTAMNSNKPLIFNGQQRKGDPLFWQADTTALTSLGFSPMVNLAEGIQKYVNWVLEQTNV